MEKIIGIFDEQTAYAERLKQYINGRKDIGCFAVTFQEEQELLNYCQRKNPVCLVMGEGTTKLVENMSTGLPCGIRLWTLSEEKESSGISEERGQLFRYQKAGEIVRQILLSQAMKEERLSELHTVFSPENSRFAEEYAEKLAETYVGQGKTLILPWDPFGGFGRTEDGTSTGTSLSELLYLIRKDRIQARQLFEGLPEKNGADYFCGADFCTDLWQYSAEEMQQLVLCCREYGGYRHVIFVAGAFHEGTVAVMNQSSSIHLVGTKTEDGMKRKKEFYRQMKYAGEQGILSVLQETVAESEV